MQTGVNLSVTIVAQHHAFPHFLYDQAPSAGLEMPKTISLDRWVKVMKHQISDATVVTAYTASATEGSYEAIFRSTAPIKHRLDVSFFCCGRHSQRYNKSS